MAYADKTYRIRVGTHNDAAMTSTYNLTNFPVQSDMIGVHWLNPVDPTGVVDEYDEIFESLDRSMKGAGERSTEWTMFVYTPLMVRYWKETIFGGALFVDVTIVTWDRAYGWRTLQCRAQWKDPAKSAKPEGKKGYKEMKISFVNCVDVTP